jgi:chromosome segregation ATPase
VTRFGQGDEEIKLFTYFLCSEAEAPVKLFNSRTVELKRLNRALAESTREKALRIEELELTLDEVELLRKRAKELEENKRKLIETTAERTAQVEVLESEIKALRAECPAGDLSYSEADLDSYRERIMELEKQERELIASAAKHAFRFRELERDLLAPPSELAAED